MRSTLTWTAAATCRRFGANFLWQVRLEDGGRTQVCYKDPFADPVFDTNERARTSTAWDFAFIGRPGARTMGLTGLGGIYTRFGTAAGRASGGLTVYRPDHWVFEGSDLYYGDLFGQGAKIVSFEVDGVDYTFRHGLPSRPMPTRRRRTSRSWRWRRRSAGRSTAGATC